MQPSGLETPGRRRSWWGVVVLALILPLGLAAAWGVMRFGGGLERLRADEVRVACEALARIAEEVERRVAATGMELPAYPPFEPGSAASLPALVDIGLEYEALGEPLRALGFLDRAAEELGETLPGEAVLARARCLAASGARDEALGVLRARREHTVAGPLSFELLARLLEARIACEGGDEGPGNALMRDLVAGVILPPARAVGPVVDLLRYIGIAPVEGEDAALAGARAVRTPLFGWITESLWIGRDCYLVVDAERAMRVHTPRTLAAVLAEQLAAAAARHPQLELRTGEVEGEALATLAVAPLETEVHAMSRGTLASARWAQLADLLLVLAGVTLLLGNLLAFRLARREAALSRMKSGFIDLVSHELRTPLAALSLRTEMLANGTVPAEKQAAYHRAAHTEVGKLSALVGRILDFARLARGRVPFEPREVVVRELIAGALREGRTALRLAGQRLELDVPRDLPSVRVDPELARRALRNLLENCARHAPEDSEVNLRAARAGAMLEIAVADRGPGVPSAVRTAVFEPFRRAHSAGGGSGLGLALVREAMRRHGGAVELSERAGGGAVFTLRFPLAREERA